MVFRVTLADGVIPTPLGVLQARASACICCRLLTQSSCSLRDILLLTVTYSLVSFGVHFVCWHSISHASFAVQYVADREICMLYHYCSTLSHRSWLHSSTMDLVFSVVLAVTQSDAKHSTSCHTTHASLISAPAPEQSDSACVS